MKASRTAIVMAVCALVAGLATPARAGDWPQQGNDGGQSYSQPDDPAIGVDSVASLALAWRNDVVPARFEEISSGAAVADGVVYAAGFGRVVDGTAVSRLYALDLATGAERWSAKLPGLTRWTPSVEDGVVVLAVERPDLALGLYAVDATTGARRWYRPLACADCRPNSTETWPAVVADGVAIAAMGGAFSHGDYGPYGRIWVFDVRDGTQLWTRALRNPSLPVVADGALFVGEESVEMNAEGSLHAYELRTGVERWQRRDRIKWYVDLAAAGHEVFVGTGRTLLSLSTSDGSIGWHRWLRAYGYAPTIGPRSLFITGYGGSSGQWIASLDRSTGQDRWSRELSDFGFSISGGPRPLVNGVLFVTGRYEYGDRRSRRPPSNDTYAVGAWGGRIIARLPEGLSGLESFRAAVADGYLVITGGTEVRAYTVAPAAPRTEG